MILNKKILILSLLLSWTGMLFYSNCTYDQGIVLGGSGYPAAVENIMLRKCATAGCHNTQSKSGAAGIDLSSWDNLFKGGDNGAEVIPYRSDQSYMMYFINTYADLGPQLVPTMPYNNTPLTHDEVAAIKTWIDNGAPNNSGKIMWSDNPNRKKFYVLNQQSDLVTVFDQATRLAMNVITIGDTAFNTSPHSIKVSPDNQSWYVDFYGGNILEMHSTTDDHLVSKIPMPSFGSAGLWSSFAISPDSKRLYITDWEGNGMVAYINLETMIDEADTNWIGSNLFLWSHGSILDSSGNTLYVAGQQGNFYYKLDVTPSHQPTLPSGPIALNAPIHWNNITPNLDPHEMLFSPDYSQLYFTCQDSNEVIAINPLNNTLLARIPVGIYPQELSISKTYPYLFISCQEDTLTLHNSFERGLISVINYQTNTLVKNIYTGWQPHGIAVDDAAGVVYVANQNFSNNGPAPHHSIIKGQRDGYITIIDMNTLELVPNYNTEVSSKPYSIAIRH